MYCDSRNNVPVAVFVSVFSCRDINSLECIDKNNYYYNLVLSCTNE